jgi:hypothetical protein
MALIKCSECKQTISDKAKTCPHCGAAQRSAAVADVSIGKDLKKGLIIIVLLICAGVILNKPSGPDKNPSTQPSAVTTSEPTPSNGPVRTTSPKRGLTWDIEHAQSTIGADNIDIFKLAAARILAEDPNCDLIDSGYLNTTPKIISEKPFFVTCTAKDGFMYNIFFDRTDLASQSPLRGALPYDERLSRDLCEKKIRKIAEHPSTVDIHSFTGYGTKVFPKGRPPRL